MNGVSRLRAANYPFKFAPELRQADRDRDPL
jgi:hypothetical protein